MRSNATGQATAEYVGVLALAAVVFVAAGAAVGLGDVGTAVAATVRTGICIVTGDICRDSDAAAAGLHPCTVGERTEGAGTTFSVGWFRIGGSDGLVVATRSDGSVLVTKTTEGRGGAVAGLGLEASPLGVDVGVEGAIDFTLMSGATWEFPSLAAARRFLAGDHDQVRPTWEFGDAGEVLSAEAKATVGGATLAGVGASATSAAGARVGRGHVTVYIRVRLETGAKLLLPGSAGRIAGPSTGDVMVELTFERGVPREIAFRGLGRDADGGRVVDTVARLDLRDPANRRAAETVLARLPSGAAVNLRALMLYTVRHGTVERAVYDVRDDSSGFELGVKVGAALGVETEDVEVERRLVAASAWTHGSQERLREDCVDVTAAPPGGTS